MPTKSAASGDLIEIQSRDLALLTGLYESRVMTLDHMAALYFEGRREAAKKRVQKLKANGFLAERPRRSTQPSALSLTRDAIRWLLHEGALDSYPKLPLTTIFKRTQVSDLTLAHELDVVSVKAAFARAIRTRASLSLAECSTWPLLNQFHVPRHVVEPKGRGELLVKPDGFLRIHETHPDDAVDEHAFFLEVDRSTESLEVLARKALAYGHYYRSGGFAEHCGGKRADFTHYPFRVLFIMHSETRRDNAARRLLENDPPTLTQVWLATSESLVRDALAFAWRRPQDLRGSGPVLYRLLHDLHDQP